MRIVNSVRCHFWVLLSILLDAGVAALVVMTYKYDVLLPYPKNNLEKNAQNFLPTFGALIGALIAFCNKNAVAALVTIHARRRLVRKGITFRQLGYYDQLSQGSIPWTIRSIFFFGVTVMLAVGFLTTAVVNSLTPTTFNSGVARTMPTVSFSSNSGVTPPIYCENGAGNVEQYGYGINCPLDTHFGDMSNAYIDSMRGTFPVNSTVDGVSYPSSLVGISGAVSTLTQRYANAIRGIKNAPILPTDTLDTCVPRVVVSATCFPNLAPGMSWQMSSLSVSGDTPKNIYKVSLCSNGGSCIGPRYAPNYGNGIISLFRTSDTKTGNLSLSIFSVDQYAADLTSPGIYCAIAASEVFVPIRITGGLSVSSLPSLSCAKQSAPSPVFLTNITKLAGMSLEKSQGQDGKLEAISYIPSGTNKIAAIELGIERMVSIGATAMYSTLDALSGSDASWSQKQKYIFQTRRSRLGVRGEYTVIFILAPGTMLVLLLISWLAVGFAHERNLSFNPLDPPSAIVAGMNRNRLPMEIAGLSNADQNKLQTSDMLLKYEIVSGERMGIVAAGSGYVDDAYIPPSAQYVEYKDGTPVASPFPSPQVQGRPVSYFR